MRPENFFARSVRMFAPRKKAKLYGIIKLFISPFDMTKTIREQTMARRVYGRTKDRATMPRAEHSNDCETLKCVVMVKAKKVLNLPVRAFPSARDGKRSLFHLCTPGSRASRLGRHTKCYHVLSIETLKRFIAHFWCFLLYDKFKTFFIQFLVRNESRGQ